ncbi:hypothetical protein R3P38DRAFT_3376019 [Favolaschia claudopus]|uniref:Uncharacterized protein n=1 Tax=Favolaschia claudopus TaxID=2862362 RepID=A0AAV9ZIX0_9AGAR
MTERTGRRGDLRGRRRGAGYRGKSRQDSEAAVTATWVEGGIGAQDIIEGAESDVESEMGRSGERRVLEECFDSFRVHVGLSRVDVGKRGGGFLFALRCSGLGNEQQRMPRAKVTSGEGAVDSAEV